MFLGAASHPSKKEHKTPPVRSCGLERAFAFKPFKLKLRSSSFLPNGAMQRSRARAAGLVTASFLLSSEIDRGHRGARAQAVLNRRPGRN